jgi:hypothetical protein
VSKHTTDFAVTYDQQYRWWSVSCGECGEFVKHEYFATAFAFAFKHKKCKGGEAE